MNGWGKSSDKRYTHDKFRNLSFIAWGLWDYSRAYSSDNSRDGFIPEDVIRKAMRDHARGSRMVKIAEELVEAGLWEVCDGGWMIHDFLEYHVSRAEKEAYRRREADRKQASRDRARDDITNRGSHEDRTRIARGSHEDRTFEDEAAGQLNMSCPIDVDVDKDRNTLTRVPTGRAVLRSSRRPMTIKDPDGPDGLVLAYVEHYEKITGGVCPEETRVGLRTVFERLLRTQPPDVIRAAFAWWDGFAPPTFPSAINRMQLAGKTMTAAGNGMSTADQRVAAGLALVAKYEAEELQGQKEIMG